MSHGKGAVVVISAAELRRIELARAKSSLLNVQDRFDVVAEEHVSISAEYGSILQSLEAPILRDSEDPEAVWRQVADLERLIVDTRQEQQRAVGQLLAKREGSVVDIEGESVSILDLLPEREVVREDAGSSQSISVDQIDQILGKVSPMVSQTWFDRLSLIRSQILSAPSASRAEALLTQLVFDAQKANDSLTAARDQASELMGHLSLAETEGARESHAWLTSLVDGTDRADEIRMAAALEAIRIEESAAADRHLSDAVADAMRSIGYVVEVGFVDRLESDGSGMAASPAWNDHAVEFERTDDGFEVQTVRLSNPEGSRDFDAAAQTKFCDDFPKFLRAIEAAGIEVSQSKNVPPGLFASHVASRPSAMFEAQRQQTAPQEKELR